MSVKIPTEAYVPSWQRKEANPKPVTTGTTSYTVPPAGGAGTFGYPYPARNFTSVAGGTYAPSSAAAAATPPLHAPYDGRDGRHFGYGSTPGMPFSSTSGYHPSYYTTSSAPPFSTLPSTISTSPSHGVTTTITSTTMSGKGGMGTGKLERRNPLGTEAALLVGEEKDSTALPSTTTTTTKSAQPSSGKETSSRPHPMTKTPVDLSVGTPTATGHGSEGGALHTPSMSASGFEVTHTTTNVREVVVTTTAPLSPAMWSGSSAPLTPGETTGKPAAGVAPLSPSMEAGARLLSSYTHPPSNAYYPSSVTLSPSTTPTALRPGMTSAPMTPSMTERSPISRLPLRMKSPLWVPPSPATSQGMGGAPLRSSSKSSPGTSSRTGLGGTNAAVGLLNPEAMEFSPLLPTTTAAVAAAAEEASKRPPGKEASLAFTTTPAVPGGKPSTVSMREMLGVPAYVPERTLTRVTLQRPTLHNSTAFGGAVGGNIDFGRGSTVHLLRTPGGERGDVGPNGVDGVTDLNEEKDLRMSLAGKFRDLWKLHFHPRSGDRWGSKEGGAASGNTASSLSGGYHPVLVATIEDIPTFWRVWNNVPTPTQKKSGTYYFFRDDIDPKWEHEANKGGGTLRLTMGEDVVDQGWEALLLRAVGASWSWPDLRLVVNGIGVKMRDCNMYGVELWVTKDSEELRRDLRDIWMQEVGRTFDMTYVPFASPGGNHLNSKANTNAAEKKGNTNKNSKPYPLNGNNGEKGKEKNFGQFRTGVETTGFATASFRDPASELRSGK